MALLQPPPPIPLGRSSDERLARRATKGDRQALGVIFERYQQELYRFCLGLLGEPQDAQDALQNAMVKALRALPGEKREIALRPWLYRIAHNEAINLRRGRRATQALDRRLRDGHSSVAEAAEHRERLQWALRDLRDLPDRQRAVLVMRELSGLDFADIGAALGTSGAVVRQTLYEARRNLEQMDRGRGLRCEAVTRVLSDADGRVSSRREIRAHLRDCPNCRRFQERIEARKEALAGLAPLPAGAAAGLLQTVLGGAGGSAAGGITAAAGGGVAQSVGTAGILKAVAAVAAVAVVGTATVERSRHEHRAASDVAATPLTQRSHAARPTGSSPLKSRLSRQAQRPAHHLPAVSAPVAGNATPGVVARRTPSAPAALDRSIAPGADSFATAPAAGATQSHPDASGPSKAEGQPKVEKQEEQVAGGEAEDATENTDEAPAPPAESPEEVETTPAPEAEVISESPSHSPNGKAKGHEKQASG